MILQELLDKKIASPPAWLPQNTIFLATMGSVAYGVATDTSDFDIYGYCIPPKKYIFPYAERLYNFDKIDDFKLYQQHHCFDQDALGGKGREYDFNVFNIVRYFNLSMEGNPNLIDSMYVSQSCILHSTKIAEMIRDKRHLFLSKLIWPRFKGYAFSQASKMNCKRINTTAKIVNLEEKLGLSHKIKFSEVEMEMKKRNLLPK